MGADRVALVQDVGAVGAVLGNEGVRVSDDADGVVDGLVRVHGHLRDAVQAHGAVGGNDVRDGRAREDRLALGEVEVDVLELVARLGLAQRVVLRREEVGLGVGAFGVGGELAVDVLLGGGPLAQETNDGGLGGIGFLKSARDPFFFSTLFCFLREGGQ